MSEENVDVVRSVYEAMNEGDFARVPELAHEDAVWVPDSRVGGEPIEGVANVVGFFRDRAETFDELRVDTERLWDLGDRVLAFVGISGRGKASGAEFEIRIAHLWTLRDGVVVRGEGYGDRDEALGAAGVPADRPD